MSCHRPRNRSQSSPLPWRGFIVTLAVAHFLVPLPLMAAGPKGKVLVLQTQSEELGADDRSAATTVLRDAVKQYPDATLIDTPKDDLLDVMIELECVDYDAACLTAMGKKWGADHVIFTQIAESGGYAVTVTVVDVAKGAVVKSEKASVGAKGGLPGKLTDLVKGVYGPPPTAKVDPPAPKLTVVTLSASREGAKVFLNDTFAGKSPLKVKLKPGAYRVKMVADGFEEASDRIVVKAGKTQTVHLDMKPVAVAKPVEKPIEEEEEATPIHKQWWFWTVIGAVVVGGVVTAAVLGTQEDEPASTGSVQFGFGSADQDPLVRGAR